MLMRPNLNVVGKIWIHKQPSGTSTFTNPNEFPHTFECIRTGCDESAIIRKTHECNFCGNSQGGTFPDKIHRNARPRLHSDGVGDGDDFFTFLFCPSLELLPLLLTVKKVFKL